MQAQHDASCCCRGASSATAAILRYSPSRSSRNVLAFRSGRRPDLDVVLNACGIKPHAACLKGKHIDASMCMCNGDATDMSESNLSISLASSYHALLQPTLQWRAASKLCCTLSSAYIAHDEEAGGAIHQDGSPKLPIKPDGKNPRASFSLSGTQSLPEVAKDMG